MALMNTSESMARASTVLAEKCEQTQKNMSDLMAKAGCAGVRLISVYIPRAESKGDDVVSVGLNGTKFYFLRGKTTKMPVNVAEILYNTGTIDDDPAQMAKADSAQDKGSGAKGKSASTKDKAADGE